jgi:hypothetical protein
MEWIRKIQSHEEERDRSGIFFKNKKERKKEIVAYMEVPILMCSPLVRNTLGLSPSRDPPSEEPIPMGTSPTTKATPSEITTIIDKTHCYI